MRLEDVIHFYIGCDVQHNIGDDYLMGKLIGIIPCDFDPSKTVCVVDHKRPKPSEYYLPGTKLILRPLSDMTKDEAKEFYIMEGWGENLSNIIVMDDKIEFNKNNHTQAIARFTRLRPKMFAWLISKHFDIFELIASGCAIDATKIKNT